MSEMKLQFLFGFGFIPYSLFVYFLNVFFSFEDNAEAKCRENIDKALDADATNAEAYQLLASFWLCKEDKQVLYLPFLQVHRISHYLLLAL